MKVPSWITQSPHLFANSDRESRRVDLLLVMPTVGGNMLIICRDCVNNEQMLFQFDPESGHHMSILSINEIDPYGYKLSDEINRHWRMA